MCIPSLQAPGEWEQEQELLGSRSRARRHLVSLLISQAKGITDEGADSSSSCQKGSELRPQALSNPYHLLCRHESAGEDPQGHQGDGCVFRYAVPAGERREMSVAQPSLVLFVCLSIALHFALLHQHELGILDT